MAKFKITQADKFVIDRMAADADNVTRSGITYTIDDYATKTVPIQGIDNLVPVGSDAYNQTLDGIKAGFAVPYKYMGPIFGQKFLSPVSPSISIATTPTEIINYQFPEPFDIERQALVTVQFSIKISASSYDNVLAYYLRYGNALTTKLYHYIKDSSYHQITGSWLALLYGTPTITLHAYRSGGGGTQPFTIDSNCSAVITVTG
jgi:hypothetical protein